MFSKKNPGQKIKIAIIGGGPASLFAFKELVASGRTGLSIEIFEATNLLGRGMPYSEKGAAMEHITNVSANEIPALPIGLTEWVKMQPDETLAAFKIDRSNFHEYKVVPRLLFGQYLEAQFENLLQQASGAGIGIAVFRNSIVTDIVPADSGFIVETNGLQQYPADIVIMCTGHYWPKGHESVIPGYFDSPYPPAKLAHVFNHPVAISGGSLTAIDAVGILAKQHGYFQGSGMNTKYVLHPETMDFKIILHSIEGLLPALRFHLDDSHLENDYLLTKKELECHMQENDGFLSLDFVFENDFKRPIREKEPAFYGFIKDMTMEEFVTLMMNYRENKDPFALLQTEYDEALRSILERKSIYWKEMLGVLSFAMNYPAKHFSAEDMLRLRKTLMPLISVVIAYLPQKSCEELLALHRAGVLEMVAVNEKSKAIPVETGGVMYEKVYYNTYINCIGQPHLMVDQFPFAGIRESGIVTQALIKFRSADKGRTLLESGEKDIVQKDGVWFLKVPGIAINDCFQPVSATGSSNGSFYVMAVPHISGYNPDYSGLDFCEEASGIIIKNVLDNHA